MNDKVKVIGIYKIQENDDVHLIELEINEKPSIIDVGKFTQETPNVQREDWQVAYDEHYLTSAGDKVIGDYLRLPENDKSPTRLTFFLYFINFELPLLSQFGEIELMCATLLPERLKNIITFEDAD